MLLNVTKLKTDFFLDSVTVPAVSDATFTMGEGEILGLVGESGSGKTMTALSIMRLVPSPGRITGGSIFFEGKDILTLSEKELQEVRGNRIGMIFQEPMTSLNPVLRVGEQIGETLLFHSGLSKKNVKEKVIHLLSDVGFSDPGRRYIQYPHQLSGGQRQRALIAMAIACNPSLVIADEPTTALDVATESQILYLLEKLVRERKVSLMFITHNLNILKRFARRIAIMYAGKILEINTVHRFYENPLHPYSRGLLNSIEGFKENKRRLKAIPGSVPKMSEVPAGCSFHPRCASAMDICKREEPPIILGEEGTWVRCYLYQN